MDFKEPIDEPDAIWRSGVLEDEIKRIESQLADPRRKTDRASGAQLSDDKYQGWRAKADDALYHKRTELGYLQAWLQRKGASRPEPTEELVLAIEDVIPILENTDDLLRNPAVQRLRDAFAFITGAFRKE